MRAAPGIAAGLLVLLVAPEAIAKIAVVGVRTVPVFRSAIDAVVAAQPDAVVLEPGQGNDAELADRLTQSGVNAVVAVGPEGLRVAGLTQLPIVHVLVAHPPAPQQGRPMIGIDLYVPPAAMLEVLSKLAPKARQLWTVNAPAESGPWVERFKLAAGERGLPMTAQAASDPAEAVRRLLEPPAGAQVYVMFPDRVVRTSAADKALYETAFEHRIAVIGLSADDVKAGALFALTLDPSALGTQAAALAVQMGASPGEFSSKKQLPPAGTQLVLNRRTARFLGLTIPPEVLSSAAEVLGE